MRDKENEFDFSASDRTKMLEILKEYRKLTTEYKNVGIEYMKVRKEWVVANQSNNMERVQDLSVREKEVENHQTEIINEMERVCRRFRELKRLSNLDQTTHNHEKEPTNTEPTNTQNPKMDQTYDAHGFLGNSSKKAPEKPTKRRREHDEAESESSKSQSSQNQFS